MIIEIENYRGWEITFNTDTDEFRCVSDSWDTDKTRLSFTALKKFIDDFIKDNQTFKPVMIEPSADSWRHNENKKLIGLRKDGRFIYEDDSGKKKQLSSYDEKEYVVLNPANKPHRDKIKELEGQIEALNKQIKKEREKITGQSLEELRKQYL